MDAVKEDRWKTSAKELVLLFRDSLLAVIPVIEQARISWRDSTYDDWDRIANALFESIVNDAIRNATVLAENRIDGIDLLHYDSLRETYEGLAFVEVVGADAPPTALAAFHSFGTEKDPLDTVRYIRMDRRKRPFTDPIGMMKLADADWQVRLDDAPHGLQTFREFEVSL